MRTGTLVLVVGGAVAVSVGAVMLLRKPAAVPPPTATRPPTTGTGAGWLGAFDAVAAAAPGIVGAIVGATKPTTPSAAASDPFQSFLTNIPGSNGLGG